jgi:hypothetical protein
MVFFAATFYFPIYLSKETTCGPLFIYDKIGVVFVFTEKPIKLVSFEILKRISLKR